MKIERSKVNKYFGKLHVIKDLDLTIQAGEKLVVIGPSGCGKTTTLRMLATMLKPTSGDATVCGHSITREPERVRRNIGFMSTATSLYGRLTAREMVTYFGRLNGMGTKEIQRRATELFRLFDMEDFANRRCDKLSSGMKQKVSIVRTVLHDPDLAEAITDRVLERGRFIELRGQSYRTRHLKDAEKGGSPS